MAHEFFRLGVRPWGFLSLAMAIACIGTAVGFLGRLWWPFELASHFRAQYFFFLLAGAFIFLLGRKQGAAMLAGVFALINLSLIAPLYFGDPSADGGSQTYRALLINVDRSNNAYGEFGKFIRSVGPDFVVLVEVGRPVTRELQRTLVEHPFSRSVPRKGGSGVALFSRIPFEDIQIREIGEAKIPSVVARYEVEGQPFTLIGAHPYSPKGPTLSGYRNHQLAKLADVVSSQQGSVMVLGDLNITSWSPFFRDLLRKTGLRDSRKGFGLQPTWPTGFPPLWIPIDHCLVSSGVVVHNRKIGPNIGSDHYPIVVDFSLQVP